MSNFINYKGYQGSVEFSQEDRVFWGKIEFINDLITFESKNADDLEKEFQAAVDDYLKTCKALGRKPQKAFRGKFNVRVKPELHKKAAMLAQRNNISLNKFVENAIDHQVNQPHCCHA